MSPEQEHEFETVWPDLAVRLTAFLARKRVPFDQREDLVQETGARLVSNWDKVDTARPTWPLAMTIALNLVRDRARRSAEREVVADIPDVAQDYDLEAAGIARLELGRVRSALPQLSQRQREVLLAEIGRETASTQADKMTRSRARRKLNYLVGRASSGLAFQFRRLADLMHTIAGTDGALQGLGCSACALLAVTAVLVPHTAPAQSSELAPVEGVIRELTIAPDAHVAGSALSAAAARSAAAEMQRDASGSTQAHARSAKARSKKAASAETDPTAAETTVPSTSDLPSLPGRSGPKDEVPVPQPPSGAKQITERVTSSVATTAKVQLPL